VPLFHCILKEFNDKELALQSWVYTKAVRCEVSYKFLVIFVSGANYSIKNI